MYYNVHSGCCRWGVREAGFGPQPPTVSEESPEAKMRVPGSPLESPVSKVR